MTSIGTNHYFAHHRHRRIGFQVISHNSLLCQERSPHLLSHCLCLIASCLYRQRAIIENVHVLVKQCNRGYDASVTRSSECALPGDIFPSRILANQVQNIAQLQKLEIVIRNTWWTTNLFLYLPDISCGSWGEGVFYTIWKIQKIFVLETEID